MIRQSMVSTLAATLALIASAAAQSGPLPLPPAKPIAPAQAGGAAAAKATPKSTAEQIAPASIIPRANAYLNSITTMVADFIQIGLDGRRLEGKLYVQKPGRLRFQYAPPATLQVVADGTAVAVQDKKVKPEPDVYFIGQTPLKFLLSDKIDLARDTKVIDVSSDAQAVSIRFEDRATFGGTTRIKLIFDPVNFSLKQWVVTDPQGYETVVSLFNVDLTTKPDTALFKINSERMFENRK